MKKRFAAVDTHFLLALLEGDEDCQSAVDWLTSNNIFVVVTSSVRQELYDMSLEAVHPEDRQSASDALASISTQWSFLPLEPLKPANNGIAHILSQKILETGILGEVDSNAGLALVEASLESCCMFITNQPELIQADWNKLRMVMVENDLENVIAMTPREINSFVSYKMAHVKQILK